MRHQRDRPTGRRLDATALRRADGVETLEVALIGALVMIALLVAVPILSGGVASAISSVATAIENAGVELE